MFIKLSLRDGLARIGRIHLIGVFVFRDHLFSGRARSRIQRLAEGAVIGGRILRGVADDADVLETGVIKGFTNGANASIHHVAGSNQVGPGLRLHHRLFAQLVDGFIVQHDAFWAHNPVVAITGVRIEGHVGHDRHLGDIPLELTNRPGDQTVGIETF